MRYTDNGNTIKVKFDNQPSEYMFDRKRYLHAVAALEAVYQQPGAFNPLIFDGVDNKEKRMLIEGFVNDFTARYHSKNTMITDGVRVLCIGKENNIDFLCIAIKTDLSESQQTSIADKVVALTQKGTFVFISVNKNISQYSHLFYRIKHTAQNPLRVC